MFKLKSIKTRAITTMFMLVVTGTLFIPSQVFATSVSHGGYVDQDASNKAK